MGDQIRETKSTASDIEIGLYFITSNSFKTRQKSKIFFAISLNLLIYYGNWYLQIRIIVLLACKKTDKVEQLGESSAGQAHANIIFR